MMFMTSTLETVPLDTGSTSGTYLVAYFLFFFSFFLSFFFFSFFPLLSASTFFPFLNPSAKEMILSHFGANLHRQMRSKTRFDSHVGVNL